jgi:hypothetical protein
MTTTIQVNDTILKGLAQKVLFHRAKCNGAARFGKYSSEIENQ